ncbi:MAG: helix-hairpin-helix domain-containing protein [Halanaerobium sp.]
MKNQKSIIIIIAVLLLIFFYYNQNLKQVSTVSSENNLNNLELNRMNDNLKNKEKDKTIVVHLAGAVKRPGVYKLNQSDRLVDLIKAAGGLKENADLNQINLAEKLYDGQKLVIIENYKNSSQKTLNNSTADNFEEIEPDSHNLSNDNSLININQADQEQLETLSGIGPSKAAAIIKYREENSYFSNKEDLLNVSGIGEKTLENIRDEIVLQ